MKEYKIVFTDIDDTLNPANEPVSKETIKTMDTLAKKNILTVINSGRDLGYAIEKSKEGHLSKYVIASNGAEVYDYEEDKVIYNASIKKKIVLDIYKYCLEKGITIYLNANKKRYCSRADSRSILIENIEKIVEEEPINQIVITSTNFDRMLVLPSLFEEKYKEISFVHSSLSLTEKRRQKNLEYYHDIVVKNTTKSKGIVELLDYLQIESSDAIAIGNGYDDISITEVVETSIAVEDAVDALKERAKYITKSAKEDGVSYILKKLILEEQNEIQTENR